MNKQTLKLNIAVASSCENAFEAFTDPVRLSKWFTTDAKVDLRVGGKYSNGDNDKGEYLEIDPPRKVKFTWENEKHCPDTIVEVAFKAENDHRSKIVLEHSELASEDDVRDMKTGWSWALDSLKSYLETGRPISFEQWQKSRR